jgi:hypothetical protein
MAIRFVIPENTERENSGDTLQTRAPVPGPAAAMSHRNDFDLVVKQAVNEKVVLQ